jgi:selenocysteine lyase/cysteine desulfurase
MNAGPSCGTANLKAARLVELLGLLVVGGLVRVGLAPYKTEDELERLVAAVADLPRSARGAQTSRTAGSPPQGR